MAQFAGIGSRLDLINMGSVKELEVIPVPASAVIPQKRRKKSMVSGAHLGTVRLGAQARTTSFNGADVQVFMVPHLAIYMDEWRKEKKSLSSSSFVLSAGNIDLYETEHGSMVNLERGTISPSRTLEWA